MKTALLGLVGFVYIVYLSGSFAAFSETDSVAGRPAAEAHETSASNAKPAIEDLKLRESGRLNSAISTNLKPFRLVPSPTNLTNTSDIGACVAHAGGGGSGGGVVGGLICKSLLPQGKLVLIWDYARGGALKGFNVYESVAGGPERLLATQNPEVTLYLPDPPEPGGYDSACFRVTALVGGQESRASGWFCGNRARLIHTVVLVPVIVRTSDKGDDESHPTVFLGDDEDKFWAGYRFTTGTDSGINWYNNYVFRGGVLFDPSQVAGHKVFSAKLRFQVEKSCSAAGLASDYQWSACMDQYTNCGARLFEGSVDHPWWRDHQWIDIGPPVATAIANSGPDIVIDVTPTVEGWLSGRSNVGLIITGDNENIVQAPVKPDSVCETNYVRDSIVLEISYFDTSQFPITSDGPTLRPRRRR